MMAKNPQAQCLTMVVWPRKPQQHPDRSSHVCVPRVARNYRRDRNLPVRNPCQRVVAVRETGTHFQRPEAIGVANAPKAVHQRKERQCRPM